MQKIMPCLWFDDQAEEAVRYYATVFQDVKVLDITYYGDDGTGPAGSVLTITFVMGDQQMMALNGGPHFKFNEAVSLVVHCADQAEVDSYWEKLSEGGAKGQGGWLKDRFGLSWQIVPVQIVEMMRGDDAAASGRMMQALLKMEKLDIAELQRAYIGA